MSLVVNTNIGSLNAQRFLASSSNELAIAMERLSSGKKINSAAVDAAGFAIAERMTAQVRGLNMAMKNTNDGLSLLAVIENATNDVTDMLQRMRELAIQAANDTNGGTDRSFLNDELNALKEEIQRVANQTEFNGKAYLSESTAGQTISFQVGTNEGQNISVAFNSVSIHHLGPWLDGGTHTLNDTDLTDSSLDNMGIIDTAIEQVSAQRAKYGALQNRLQYTVSNLMNVAEFTTAARSRIEDADFAAESARLAKAQVLQQTGTAMLAQANSSSQLVLSLVR